MKLFLIDGHALVFRMYYAFLGRPMVNSRGEDTSILFGFTKYLLELIDREKPTHIAVSFDPPGGTFRNEMYPEYKANRAETPQLVIDALEPLTGIVEALNIPVVMIRGFEADDVIGTMATRFASDTMDVYMVTPDKDYGQLVCPHVYQYKPGKSGSDNEVLGSEQVCDKWKIAGTSQVIDMLALCGDSADNVPGVQGVGPVGAAKLLSKYGTLEGIYEHLDELTAHQQELFRAAQDHIGLSKKLVTIKTDVPVETTVQDMVLNTSYSADILSLLDRYEMPSLKRLVKQIAGSLPQAAPAPSTPAAPSVQIVPELKEVGPGEFCGSAHDMVAVNIVGDVLHVADANICSSGKAADFRTVLENPGIVKAGYDLKQQVKALSEKGVSLEGKLMDIVLMHYLLNPERPHRLDLLARSYLGMDLEQHGEPQPELSLFDEPSETSGPDHGREAVACWYLEGALLKEMSSTEGMSDLYDRIEEPLIRVLARMETVGVKVDLNSLRDFADSLRSQMIIREDEVRRIAGEPTLNVSSPKQIGEVIFTKLQLDPKAKRPKSGSWPTDEQTLQELADRSPIIDAILDYRGLRKLLSTYIEPFPEYISPKDGRVHTTFNQALTSTGRLSSSNPNLQNIPVRTEQGREIRKAFVPGMEDSVMMSADYSQIELRLMAHLCGDEHLISAFNAGVDVHAATAARIFHVDVSEVTADQRRIAKTANFGIMYGISAFGLSQRLRCSRTEAKQIIDEYFESFPSIRSFIDSTIASARSKGYVETLFGRRRYIADISSRNANLRALAERNAVNAPIQGTAADIIKLAMAAVDRRLREENLSSRMVLQIHDELLLEVRNSEIDRVREILVSEMESVMTLSVPLTVECNYGKNWLDAH